MDDTADDVVVSEGQQVFPLCRARVPAAQADGALVRQQHIVLRVVEHALSAMHLTAAQTRTCYSRHIMSLLTAVFSFIVLVLLLSLD